MSYAFTYLPEKVSENDRFLITLAGPLDTFILGGIGWLLLANQKNVIRTEMLHWKQWIFVFLTFFWIRQPLNAFVSVIFYLITGNYSIENDEAKISLFCNFPVWFFSLVCSLISISFLSLIVLKFIPKQQSFSFIIAACFGGTIGYIVWIKILGGF